MNSDDYAKRQSQRDAQYERDYEVWVKSMTPDERRNAEKLGVLKPCLQRHGNGAADHDMADSPLASHEPDIAALVDHEEAQPETHSMGSATEILRHLVADILSEDNTRLTMDCLAIALGLRVYAGDSMTKIAKRYGITRAAVSKRCVDITERLKLPPSRAMRSEKARKIYRNSQLKRHRSAKS
jgi:DNA-binding phage protein